MAQTLVEAAKLSQNDLQRGVVETFVMESSVLDKIPFLEINGNAYAYNEEATLPGVEFRAVNTNYNETTGTVNQKTETLVILGGDADVDTFIVQTRGNLNDQRATQTNLKSKALVYKWQDAFFNGDTSVDANSFDGLKKRLTGGQVIAAGTNGLAVLGAADTDRHLFLDQLDNLIAQATFAGRLPDALYMNSLIRMKLRSSARRLTIYDQTVDSFGRKIDMYQGIPLLDPGTKADGTMILPQTEVQGTSGATTSSIYAVRYGQGEGDASVTGLTNGGVSVRDLGEQNVKPVYRTRIEFFNGLGVFGGRAAARLTGVLNS